MVIEGSPTPKNCRNGLAKRGGHMLSSVDIRGLICQTWGGALGITLSETNYFEVVDNNSLK